MIFWHKERGVRVVLCGACGRHGFIAIVRDEGVFFRTPECSSKQEFLSCLEGLIERGELLSGEDAGLRIEITRLDIHEE